VRQGGRPKPAALPICFIAKTEIDGRYASPSPCLRRLRRLENEGLVAGYHALLNREAIGLGVTAFVRVNIKRHRGGAAEAFTKAVTKLPEVISCYITSGESDFLLHVVVPDLPAYREFALEKLMRVPGIKDMCSSFVVSTLKEAAPLPIPRPIED
jgi:Lrp/AsnC family transcriptional regulator, leucine-responsive regulatory protein